MLKFTAHPSTPAQDTPSPRRPEPGKNDAATHATTQLLQTMLPHCAACNRSFNGHTHRFFSCHPASSANLFLKASRAGEWATVHSLQTPSVDQPKFMVYAIACPASANTGGMVTMLRFDAKGTATLDLQQALTLQEFAALRALCPTCQWIAFTPALQSGQENV